MINIIGIWFHLSQFSEYIDNTSEVSILVSYIQYCVWNDHFDDFFCHPITHKLLIQGSTPLSNPSFHFNMHIENYNLITKPYSKFPLTSFNFSLNNGF